MTNFFITKKEDISNISSSTLSSVILKFVTWMAANDPSTWIENSIYTKELNNGAKRIDVDYKGRHYFFMLDLDLMIVYTNFKQSWYIDLKTLEIVNVPKGMSILESLSSK